jgi:hypothetical protein
MIPDEYEFGSSAGITPKCGKKSFAKQARASSNPIESGDTLIMYIAQIRPYK